MDPNNPTNDQQQMQGQPQMPADNSQAAVTGQEPAQTAPVTGVVAEPPAAPVTPQEEVAGGVSETGQQQGAVQTTQGVPEQVNPVDASQYPSPTVPTAGTAPLGGEPSGGDNNPPQAA
jgi:hypothetical protein